MGRETAWYDAAEWYDLAFSWNPKGELAFLEWAFRTFAAHSVRTVLEPGCGTGHYLIPLRERGYRVIGFDINPAMRRVASRKARAAEAASPRIRAGDFTDFALARPVDAAYMLIDTVRHLTTERALRSHFRSMARAVRPGGVHVLGVDLADPDATGAVRGQRWTVARGDRRITVEVGTWRGPDRRRKQEFHEPVYECVEAGREFRIVTRCRMRYLPWPDLVTYARIGRDWDLAWATDLRYRTDEQVDPATKRDDVVLVLVRR